MVASQNGDHRNGHVLVESQQTQLDSDSEMPEAPSKSRVYRVRLFFSSRSFPLQRSFRAQPQLINGTHVMSRVLTQKQKINRLIKSVGKELARGDDSLTL